ncbi:MAG TPA: flagellar biosynthesis regulator FlaF [Pseudolabrys sp.]|jgi:flagellar protein FlaF|nr:flagellar biosynthesis regulator FlaF [Pseudolabrys sp.]
MKSAAKAYGAVANKTSHPRELEASLLLDAASRLQAAKGLKGEPLYDALTHNRKLWVLLLGTVTKNENPLDLPIRQNIANLGLFVCKQTINALIDPKPDNLVSLININRELAAGLLGRAA